MLPDAYAVENSVILSRMRREFNDRTSTLGFESNEWRYLRVRVGLRALAAVVTFGVQYNKDMWGTMQREGVWIDGKPHDTLRRPYFKCSPVVLDRSMNPSDFVVERVPA